MSKKPKSRHHIISLKCKLLKSVQFNTFVSISPAKSLEILKALDTYFTSSKPNSSKYINYTTEGLRK